LAERGRDARPLLALDVDPQRLEKVVASAQRLGLRRLRVECGDLRGTAPRPVDGVLLDAPCSALGTLAGNPDARWRLAPGDIPRLAERQRELLAAAALWPRPGGRLVYAVCTLTPEETSAQREGFLAQHAEFTLEPFTESELPAALRTEVGEYLALPDAHEGTGMYAFRCRRAAAGLGGEDGGAVAKEES
jgi:16S rRNA (cytosine967-C5)-methyltransferase